MKKALSWAVLLTVLAIAASGPAQKDPSPDNRPDTVTGRAKQGSNARDRALNDARQKAVEKYIEERVPATMRNKRREEQDRIVSRAGNMVRSFEIVEETESNNVLALEVHVELDEKEIDNHLIKHGLLPSRPLPKVFLFVPCRAGGEDIPSAWQKPKAIARTKNPCEAAIAERLSEYGIEVIGADKESPHLDLHKIMDPRSEEQKKEVFRELEDKLGVAAMVVGKGILPPASENNGQALLLIAVADLAKERVLWSERTETETEITGPEDRGPALQKLCGRAGEKALLKIFSAWSPKYMPGEERAISLELIGLSSYKAMKDFGEMLREQAPGVSEAVLSKASPGEIRFEITTTASADAMARWLEDVKVDEGSPRILSQDEDNIRAALVR